MCALFRLFLGTHFAFRAAVACIAAAQPVWGPEGWGAPGRCSLLPPLTLCPASSQNLTYEIILTLGQAFEVAYQLALQAQKSRPVGASAAEVIETRSSKPVPKPRVGVRKSAVGGPRGPGLGGAAWRVLCGRDPACLSALLRAPGAAAPR